MWHVKKLFLRIVLVIEMIVFVSSYIYGPQGTLAARLVQDEIDMVEQDIRVMRERIDGLHQEIDQLKHGDFYREKFAREHLQMGRKNDIVYRIDE